MSETTAEAPAQAQPDNDAPTTAPEDGTTPPEETDWKAEARKLEKRAKQNDTQAEKAEEKARIDAK